MKKFDRDRSKKKNYIIFLFVTCFSCQAFEFGTHTRTILIYYRVLKFKFYI